VGTPDYSDLLLDKYISVIECESMHRMWSDGRWNKLTMAHGCYWGMYFCDISLDYIKFTNRCSQFIVRSNGGNDCSNRRERISFVDEAAPPALMRALARNPSQEISSDVVDEHSIRKSLLKIYVC
jgi:hypothetical protein